MIRAELYRHDEPQEVVAVATWRGGSGRIEATGEAIEGLDSLLRPTPVVVDDAAFRPLGTHGEVALSPGTPAWFRAAIATRAPSLGLSVRFVTDEVTNGWDPAANYRTFEEQVGRLADA
jgi:hypothetical protein